MLTIYNFLGFEENMYKTHNFSQETIICHKWDRKGLAAKSQEYPEQNMPTKAYNPDFANCGARRMQKLRDYFQLLQQFTQYGLTWISLKKKVRIKKIRKN